MSGGCESCAAALEDRAARIEAQFAPDRVQPHTRQLPTEAEMDQARFAARQLRIAAEELRQGLNLDPPEDPAVDAEGGAR